MSEAEYNECQEHALELVDWLYDRTTTSHQQMLILGRALALSFAANIKLGVKPAAAKKGLLAALDKECDSAIDYCAKHPRSYPR